MSSKLEQDHVIKLRELISGTRNVSGSVIEDAMEWIQVLRLNPNLLSYVQLRAVKMTEGVPHYETIEVDFLLSNSLLLSTMARLDTSVKPSLGDYIIESDGTVHQKAIGEPSFSGVQFDQERAISFVQLLINNSPNRK